MPLTEKVCRSRAAGGEDHLGRRAPSWRPISSRDSSMRPRAVPAGGRAVAEAFTDGAQDGASPRQRGVHRGGGSVIQVDHDLPG